LTQNYDPADSEPVTIHEVEGWLDANFDFGITLEQWWERSFSAGLAFPTWPRFAGGQRASESDAARIAEILAHREIPPPPRGNGTHIGAPLLLELGSEIQQMSFLPALAQGKEAWCQLFSEPGAGSDLASLRTRADRDGDEWIINGQKIWCSLAEIADRGLLVARSNFDVPKHSGLTFFLIDMDQPGVEVRPIRQLDGGGSFSEVFFTDARIPAGRIIGGEEEGWGAAVKALGFERRNISRRQRRGVPILRPGYKGGDLPIVISEFLVGKQTNASDRRSYALPGRQLIELAQRHHVSDNPLIRQKIVEYFCLTEARRYTELRYRSGPPNSFAASAIGPMSKLALSEIARFSRNLIFEISGMDGLVRSNDPLSQVAHDTALASFAAHFGGGTDEIQRNLIAERGLGLPREPSIDTNVPFTRKDIIDESK
jgi:alkylation response protein AidB-like acyl-CoA dehydrogenase